MQTRSTARSTIWDVSDCEVWWLALTWSPSNASCACCFIGEPGLAAKPALMTLMLWLESSSTDILSRLAISWLQIA